jgi:hypothetical protein
MIPTKVMQLITWSFLEGNLKFQISFLKLLVRIFDRAEKGNMSFCHHLVSVVSHPFTFHILIFSSENPQPNELKPKQFQRRRFKKIGQSETRIACGGHVW